MRRLSRHMPKTEKPPWTFFDWFIFYFILIALSSFLVPFALQNTFACLLFGILIVIAATPLVNTGFPAASSRGDDSTN